MHTRMYAGFGGGHKKPLSEFLEHLASDNGAGMHKYNTLYTRTLSWHVLPQHPANVILKNHGLFQRCKAL